MWLKSKDNRLYLLSLLSALFIVILLVLTDFVVNDIHSGKRSGNKQIV